MDEASLTSMPRQLRFLFASICSYCGPTNPLNLWESHRDAMSEDITHHFRNIDIQEAHNIALYEIKRLLGPMGCSLNVLGIQEPSPLNQEALDWVHRNIGQIVYNIDYELEQCQLLKVNLNTEQRQIFDSVEDALQNNHECLLYIHGHGGTRKTYLYRAICH
jgi:hypothetical protein